MSNLTTKKFQIDGMHCTACAMNIDFDLEDIDGVKTAKTNYAKQITQVEYDQDKVTDQEICEVIKKTGYKAKIQENM